MLPSTLCSRARKITAQRLEGESVIQRNTIYIMRIIPIPGHLPFGFANGGFHRRNYLSSSCTYTGVHIASRRSRHHMKHKSYANPELASMNPSLETTSRSLARSCRTSFLLLGTSSHTTLDMCCITRHSAAHLALLRPLPLPQNGD